MQTDGDLIIGTEIDSKSFDSQIEELEDKLDTLAQEYEAALKDTEFPEDELKKYQSEIEKTKNKIIDLRKKQESLAKSSLIQMPSMINNISKSMSGIVSSVTKWGLALFGIRGAYSLIRQAMSTISQEDEQIATDIKYMQWILAQTLKPVVEWIVNALYLVITLINNISVALFGFNILAGKSADDFKNMKKNTGGIAKDLAKAKQQLTSFDDMNVLQDTSSSGGGNSALDNWKMPDMSEYSRQIEDIINKWKQFGEEMNETLGGGARGNFFGLFDGSTIENIMKWINAFGLLGIAIRGVTQFVYGLHQSIDGIVSVVKGVVDVVVGLVTGNTEQLFKGLFEIVDGFWKIIDGIINTFWGKVQMVVGSILTVATTVIKAIWNFLASTFNDAVRLLNTGVQKVKDFFGGIFDFIGKIMSKILSVFGDFGAKVGKTVGDAFTKVINAVLKTVENVLNTPIKGINKLVKGINDLKIFGTMKPIDTIKLPRLAKGTILNNPGHGVPVANGRAIAGEAGREAYLPLSDEQLLEELGSAIGRHTVINLTNITNMNGRQLLKELSKIQSEEDFAFNR